MLHIASSVTEPIRMRLRCLQCHSWFEATRDDAVTCSPACRVARRRCDAQLARDGLQVFSAQ